MDRRAFRPLLIVFALAAAACTPNVMAGPVSRLDPIDRPPRLLTVTGTATLDVQPDLLDVHLVVTAEAPRPKAAVVQLREKRAQLVKGMLAAGVVEANLKFSQVSLSPYYDEKGVHLLGYRATLSATASVKDFDRVGDLVEAAATAGATQITTGSHRSDLVDLKQKVRTQALEAAKAKAEQSAKILGIHLEGIANVAENGGGYWGGDGSGVSNSYARNEHDAEALNPESAPLTLTVTVSYQIGG